MKAWMGTVEDGGEIGDPVRKIWLIDWEWQETKEKRGEIEEDLQKYFKMPFFVWITQQDLSNFERLVGI